MLAGVAGGLIFVRGVIRIYLVHARRRYRRGCYQFGGRDIVNLTAHIGTFPSSFYAFCVNKAWHG